jgi:hypothetical protein
MPDGSSAAEANWTPEKAQSGNHRYGRTAGELASLLVLDYERSTKEYRLEFVLTKKPQVASLSIDANDRVPFVARS